ncbi:unnamed protein product [Owenia fusiformis]|uniref:Uncharacterized protein n=1 Tax=Owenia fusiformis TaxID=6347 RepID=A0A8J1T4H8_OWEFU|nr:unnamed protein product [Owenia fusiformis]
MKLYMLFVICLVLCLDVKGYKEKKNKISKEALPRLRLQNLVDKLPSKDIIPILNETAAIKVNFGIQLINLLELDSSQIKAVLWLPMTWKNEFLQWDPQDYDGINSIRVPIEKMWKPDIELENSVRKPEMVLESLTIVTNDGSVLWYPSMVITASCKRLDKTARRSRVNCPLKFGSWAHDVRYIDMKSDSDSVDVSGFQGSEKWELVGHSQERHAVTYEKYGTYIDVTGNLTFV